MTTVNDLLSTLDKTGSGYCTPDEIAFEFGITYCPYWETERLKSYLHQKASWMCTDTMVGISFVFFDDDFVAISTQKGRKYDKYFIWVSKEKYDKVKKWFMAEYVKHMELEEPEPSFLDFDKDDLSGWLKGGVE